MREIGSEYWEKDVGPKSNNLEYFDMGKDVKYLMSGRTAIDYILRNINDNIKIVYMPNYCCESMVIPFVDNGYKVKYYDVDIINNKYNINIEEEFSVFYAMSYFGYSKSNMDKYLTKVSDKNVIIIEDITHRLFQKNNFYLKSDYLVASLRKWFPIYSGAIAVNLKEKFVEKIDNYTVDEQFIAEKKLAMQLKRDYIIGKINDKQEYLNLYNKSNERINDYKGKKMDSESLEILKEIDINEMIRIRKENTRLIENKLVSNSNIKLIFKQEPGDCPLFVPVFIQNRDEIRRLLIFEDVYCPVHWPNFANIEKDIYKYELSLICDQRYGQNDINDYIDKLLKIVGE